MILFRQRLILGAIGRFFSLIAKVVYRILKLFNLQFAFLVLVAGLFLFVFGAFNDKTVLICFYVALIISVLGALYITATKSGRKKKKYKKDIGDVGDYYSQKRKESVGKEDAQPKKAEEDVIIKEDIKEEKPKYYKVSQNPNYIMAEYSDRYELYYKSVHGLKKIRTDYKF
ncbi:MAG: hypothetical protein IJR66_05250 [Clostridia bacterium]|nr:hypothetical protein [Clostridia bacterium]